VDTPFGEMANLDKLVHEPARLAIMSALFACQSADFLFLQRLTGLTKGNLSGHLTKLEEAELIQIEKQFIGKRPNTVITLTNSGRKTIDAYWQQLESLRHSSQQWQPDTTS
jgi:DNA-binding transcriptional ArsR family regulator